MYTTRPVGTDTHYFAAPENSKITLQTLANARNYPAMIPLLTNNLGYHLTIEDVRQEANRVNSQTLKNAFSAYDKIRALPDSGLSQKETFILCLYIESIAKTNLILESYFKKETYNIPRTVERDTSGQILIHLKTHNIDSVGRGFWKTATKSILYDLQKPEIVSTTASNIEDMYEVSLLEKFKGVSGVLQIKGYAEHKKARNSERRLHIMTKLMPQRSVNQVLDTNTPLTLKQIVSISKCAMRGLKNIHTKGYVHRDLHAGNVFIDLSGSKAKAVIGDLGQARRISDHNKGIAQLVPSYRAPEALKSEHHRHVDYCKTDSYALALVLLQLYRKTMPSWMYKITHDTLKKDPKKVTEEVIKEIKLQTDAKIKTLSKKCKKKNASDHERFEKIVLKMLRADPNKRPSIGRSLWEISKLKKAL